MNSIFFIIMIVSICFLLIINPNAIISAMLNGGQKCVTLMFSLVVIYSLWLSIMNIIEVSNLNKKLARKLQLPIELLFGKLEPKSLDLLAVCFTANLLGIGSVATPSGMACIEQFEKSGNNHAIELLFVISATSIQLLPSTVIMLRQSAGSVAPHDIFLPTLLATIMSTTIGILLVKVFRVKNHAV